MYKMTEVPGLPAWMTIVNGKALEVEAYAKRDDNLSVKGILLGYNSESDHPFLIATDYGIAWYEHAEPLTQWDPKPGELVAAWDEGDVYPVCYTYVRSNGIIFLCTVYNQGNVFECEHIARIEGVSITLGTTVEELKRKTEWL
jgi:hypothetical protein